MVKRIRFEGKMQEFPDDFTDEEISNALSGSNSTNQNNTPEDKNKLQNHLENLIGIGKNPNNDFQDVGKGVAKDIGIGALRGGQNLASSLGEAGQYIGDSAVNKLSQDFTGRNANVPKVNIREEMGMGQNNPVDLNQFFGQKNPNAFVQGTAQYAPAAMMGSPISLGGAGNALGKIPYLGNLAKNILTQGTKPAAYMATQDENPLRGAAEGYAGEAILGAGLPAAFKGIDKYLKSDNLIPNSLRDISSKVFNKFAPGKQAEHITNELSQGSETADQSSKKLVKDLQEGYNSRVAQSGAFFDYPLQRAGKELIYEKPDPLISTQMDKLKPLTDKMEDLGIGDLYNAFKSKPTFQNAHLLQSELGSMVRRLEKNPIPSTADQAEIKNVKSIRERLKSDINNFLEKRDLNSNERLAPSYKRGSDFYFENVTPYLADKRITQAVKEGKTIVKNIHQSFNTPSNTINKETGKEVLGPINKILQDLPETSKSHILFNAIGGKKESPNALLSSLVKAKNKGYGEYFSPKLEESINALNKKIKNKGRLTSAAKWGGSATGAGGIGGLTLYELQNR